MLGLLWTSEHTRKTIDETRLSMYEAVGLFRTPGTSICIGLRISLKTNFTHSYACNQ